MPLRIIRCHLSVCYVSLRVDYKKCLLKWFSRDLWVEEVLSRPSSSLLFIYGGYLGTICNNLKSVVSVRFKLRLFITGAMFVIFILATFFSIG